MLVNIIITRLQPASDEEHVPHVPRAGEGRLRRGVRLPGEGDRQDVRLQEAGEEAHQEAEGRGDGAQREADTAEGQLEVHREYDSTRRVATSRPLA